MQKLAKREEEIMQILWKLEKGFIKEIIEEMPEPKPHYNTVSTIVRILSDKGYIGHISFGNADGLKISSHESVWYLEGFGPSPNT